MIAANSAIGRLYVLMHQGEEGDAALRQGEAWLRRRRGLEA